MYYFITIAFMVSLSINTQIEAKSLCTAKRVIIVSDVGLDDYLAIVFLIEADIKGHIQLEGIVCGSGQVPAEDSCRNVIRLLELVKRTDIPVFKGVREALIIPDIEIVQYSGKNGLGDLDLPEPNMNLLQPLRGPEAIYKIVKKYPKQVSIITTGTLTDYALAVKLYDDFEKNIRDLWIMGGNFDGDEGINLQDEMTAEMNFFIDVEAAFIALNSTTAPVYILPWETCLLVDISFEHLYELLDNGSPALQLMRQAEMNLDHEAMGETKFIGCDSYLAYSFLNPKHHIIKKSRHQATVILHDEKLRGLMKFDQDPSKPKITFIERINDNLFKKDLVKITI